MCSAARDPDPHAVVWISGVDSKMCASGNEAEEVACETLECHRSHVLAGRFGVGVWVIA